MSTEHVALLPAPTVDALPGQAITITITVVGVPDADAAPFLLHDDVEQAAQDAQDAVEAALFARRRVVEAHRNVRVMRALVSAADLPTDAEPF